MSSLAERALGRKAAAPAPSAGGKKRKAAQPSWAAKAKATNSKNMSGVGFSPRHGRAGRRGTAMPAAATGASTTTSTAPPTQPVLPHPPPHQVSLGNSSRLSSRYSNRSSNLNSSPGSSSSRRRPRGAGFSSQALPTSAEWLAAVGETEVDAEAPTRGAVAPGDAVPVPSRSHAFKTSNVAVIAVDVAGVSEAAPVTGGPGRPATFSTAVASQLPSTNPVAVPI